MIYGDISDITFTGFPEAPSALGEMKSPSAVEEAITKLTTEHWEELAAQLEATLGK
jgi:hypothetical protein